MNITTLSNIRLRNLIRGALSNTSPRARLTTLTSARRLLEPSDAASFAGILCTTDLESSYYGPPFPDKTSTLFRLNRRTPVPLDLELQIQFARIHQHINRLSEATIAIGKINDALLRLDISRALSLLADFHCDHGVSVLLAKKLAYLHFALLPTHPCQDEAAFASNSSSLLGSILGHHESSLYSQYVNLIFDNFDIDTSCFQIRHDHIQILKRSLPHATRPTLISLLMQRILYPTLSTTLLNAEGLLFFSSSSLLDLVTDLITLSHHPELNIATLRGFFSTPEFQQLRDTVRPNKNSLRIFVDTDRSELREQAAYRASFAFTELRQFARWRQALDVELFQRDGLVDRDTPASFAFFPKNLTLSDLCVSNPSPMRSLQRFEAQHSQSFLRTIAVLSLLGRGATLSNLSALEIRILLSNTTNFSKLLREDELLRLREHSEKEESHIICFLAMVMLNARKPNEDLEFEMRMTFQKIVQEDFDSNIREFLVWLHDRTPNLCPPLVELFDISFLERLYLLHNTFEVVLQTRGA